MSPLNESLTLAAVFVVVGILAKYAARRDNDPSPKINELAVSTSISLMTLSKIFSDLLSAAIPSHETLLFAAIGFGGILFFVVMERFTSWHVTQSPPKKKIWIGIVAPDVIAISVLFLYYWLRYGRQGP
jgi:hypothetical protein